MKKVCGNCKILPNCPEDVAEWASACEHFQSKQRDTFWQRLYNLVTQSDKVK